MTSTTCRENKARTEGPEEWCENRSFDAFDEDNRARFMTRYPVLVRFRHWNWHENKHSSRSRNPSSMSSIVILLVLEEVAPGLTVEDVQRATEATLIISPSLKNMES